MAAWVFNKTLWVQDNPPYVTAAQLNRIEAGIDAVTPKALDLDGVNTGTFAGLDGANDKGYVIEGTGYLAVGTAVYLRPNASLANTFRTFSHQAFQDESSQTHSIAAYGSADAFTLGGADWGLAGHFIVHAMVTARRVGASVKMICMSKLAFSPEGDGIAWPSFRLIERDNTGVRSDATAPAVSSLTLSSGGGNFTDTRFTLRPIGR